MSDAINIEYIAWRVGRVLITTGWISLPRNGCTVNHPRNLNLQEKDRVFGWIVTTTQKFSGRKKNQLHSQVLTEASFSWKVSVAPQLKECTASYFKHSRNEYKWEKIAKLVLMKIKGQQLCCTPAETVGLQKKSNSVTQSFLHAFTLQSDGRI